MWVTYIQGCDLGTQNKKKNENARERQKDRDKIT